ncbi:MAG: transporter substrate-binding domain-containing protein, partial [Rhodospirillales bacterium]|nr:transporter substrate-binding domain-containing protein [Rhodospirillales bacterium]
MKIHFWILPVVFAALAFHGTSQITAEAAERTFVGASSNNFPPVNQIDPSGRLTGFGRELATAVIRAGGGKLESIHSSRWVEVLGWLATGRADFIHDTGFAKERLAYLEYTKPILEMPEHIFVKVGELSINGLDDLKGRRVACVRQHITHLYLKTVPGVECHVVESPADGLVALLSGKVVAFPFPNLVMHHLINELNFGHRFREIEKPLRDHLVWHMAVKKGNAEMRAFLNEGIRLVRASGEYDQIFAKWFQPSPLAKLSLREVQIAIVGGMLILGLLAVLLVLILVINRHREARDQLASTVLELENSRDNLSESEQRFKDFTDSASDWYWEMGADLRFVSLSDSAGRSTGIPKSHFIGLTRQELAGAAADDPMWKSHIEDLNARIPFKDFQYKFVDPNGSIRHFRTSGIPVFSNDGSFEGYRGTGSDITKTILAAEAAFKANTLLKDAINALPEGIAIFDAEERLVMFNARYADYYSANNKLIAPGVTLEELLRDSIANHHFHGIEGKEDAFIRTRLADFRAGRISEQFLTDGNRWLHVVDAPMANGYTVALRTDITEMKMRELELKKNKQRLERAHQIAMIGDWDWEYVPETDQRVEYWSPEFYDILGLEPLETEAGFDTFLAQVHEEDRPRAESLRSNSNILSPNHEVEVRIRHAKTGEIRWLDVRSELIRAENGKVLSKGGAIQDITDRKMAEEQLQQAQKMEATGQLTGGIAHEFNNLLTIILGNLRLMSRDMDEMRMASNHLIDDVISAAEEGAELTRRLLAFGRPQPQHLHTMDVNATISGFIELMDRTFGDGVEILLNEGADIPPIYVDHGQFEAALLNLALNARDAMPDGGKISIHTMALTITGLQGGEYSNLPPGNYVAVRVADSGVGISTENISRVCEPFFTTKQEGKGSGLGLSIIYRFVGQSGGEIIIDSKPDRGT